MNNNENYYLGNKNLPKVDAQYEWNSEMLNHLNKSSKDILHFAQNFFYIINLDRGKQLITLHDYQLRVLKGLIDNRFVALLASRQTGKTTLMTIYALWIVCFQKDQRILIVANKEKTAINIFKRIRTAYEMLPNYMKPGVKEYGKTSVTLENDSSIGISTTSSDAGRGDSVNVLILDELAFVPANIAETFWKSVYPIISSSKKSKIFVASTPNGTQNLFYDLYQGAIQKKNNWVAERVDWWEVPGRDEAWKQNTIREIGSEETFNQEFGNQFIEVGESNLNEHLFELLKGELEQPKYLFEEGKYKLWDAPNKTSLYAIGVDVAEGVGENASCVQVLDITDPQNIIQVAEYNDNMINPYAFTTKLNQILKHWGSPPVLIERNNHGGQVCDVLRHELHYPKIVTWGKQTNTGILHCGMYSHTNTKYKAVSNMRYWVNENRRVKIRNHELLHEMRSFVRRKNGTWGAKAGELDDRVMSLVWGLMILEREICEKYFEVQEYDNNRRPLKLLRPSYENPGEFVDEYGLLQSSRTIKTPDGEQDYNEMPMFFMNGYEQGGGEYEDLLADGWEPVFT